MKKSPWARLEIPLETTKENIRPALTLPELKKKYMYNCQLHCSWELGSEALWQKQTNLMLYDLDRIAFESILLFGLA